MYIEKINNNNIRRAKSSRETIKVGRISPQIKMKKRKGEKSVQKLYNARYVYLGNKNV